MTVTSLDMNWFCRAFHSVFLHFHEFFVDIIENIVALKITLQNPNLVQKTSSDFHLLNFTAFLCVSLHFHKFFGRSLKIFVALKICLTKIQICILLQLYTRQVQTRFKNYFHFLSFAAHFCLCLYVFTSFLLSQRDNWKLAVHVKLFFTVAANEDLLPFPSLLH